MREGGGEHRFARLQVLAQAAHLSQGGDPLMAPLGVGDRQLALNQLPLSQGKTLALPLG